MYVLYALVTWQLVHLPVTSAGVIDTTATNPDTCPPPDVVLPQTLIEHMDIFPRAEFEKNLQDESEDLRVYLRMEDILVDDIIKKEAEAPTCYPDCAYERVCLSTVRKINYWRIASRDPFCWIIQPVQWTTCDSSQAERITEETPGAGHACREVYTRKPVWAYCQDAANPIRIEHVYVAATCSAMKYECPCQCK